MSTTDRSYEVETSRTPTNALVFSSQPACLGLAIPFGEEKQKNKMGQVEKGGSRGER